MRLFFLGALTLALLSGECVQLPDQYGTVRIMAFDSRGSAVGPVNVELVDIYSGKLIRKSKNGVLNRVAFGTYLLHAYTTGFWDERRVIHVQQKRIIELIQFAPGAECHYDDSTLSGTVSPAMAGHEIWVKAVPLRGTGGAEALVEASGQFSLSGITDGPYVVMVLDDSSVLKTQIVRVEQTTHLNISLNAN